MSKFELYIFTLCLIVFVLLTVIFTAFVVCLVRMYLKMTKAGVNDEKIKKEYLKEQGKKPSIFGQIIDKAVLVLCCAVLFVMFGFGLFVSAGEGKTVGRMPVLNVVQSGSMSYVNENHKYIKPGRVDNQMQMFDLIFVDKLPKEEDLKVNDVVVYETDGALIIHRIVGIEAPNKQHPEETYFLLQGDANEIPDKFPVRYNQMKGIYRGHRIPFVGSFVLFMQSPAGYLCVLLVVFALIATPMAEKKIKTAKANRLLAMGILGGEQLQETAVAQSDDSVDPTIGEEVPALDRGVRFASFKKAKSFSYKLRTAEPVLKDRYKKIVQELNKIPKIRVIRSKKGETYRSGNNGICKLVIRGKTLNVYFALNPSDYQNTKYIYQDVSSSKKYERYAMRMKLTSDRQVKWAIELLADLTSQKGLIREVTGNV